VRIASALPERPSECSSACPNNRPSLRERRSRRSRTRRAQEPRNQAVPPRWSSYRRRTPSGASETARQAGERLQPRSASATCSKLSMACRRTVNGWSANGRGRTGCRSMTVGRGASARLQTSRTALIAGRSGSTRFGQRRTSPPTPPRVTAATTGTALSATTSTSGTTRRNALTMSPANGWTTIPAPSTVLAVEASCPCRLRIHPHSSARGAERQCRWTCGWFARQRKSAGSAAAALGRGSVRPESWFRVARPAKPLIATSMDAVFRTPHVPCTGRVYRACRGRIGSNGTGVGGWGGSSVSTHGRRRRGRDCTDWGGFRLTRGFQVSPGERRCGAGIVVRPQGCPQSRGLTGQSSCENVHEQQTHQRLVAGAGGSGEAA
jgi:hypothetical protein